MNERLQLLKKLSSAQFAALEMHLFLDTHPDDKEAIENFKKYRAIAEKFKKEYEEKYGSITAGDFYGNNRWEWINNPWPWEKEMGMK